MEITTLVNSIKGTINGALCNKIEDPTLYSHWVVATNLVQSGLPFSSSLRDKTKGSGPLGAFKSTDQNGLRPHGNNCVGFVTFPTEVAHTLNFS